MKKKIPLQNDYFFKEWYDLEYQPELTRVRCFKGDTQEPYVFNPSPHSNQYLVFNGYLISFDNEMIVNDDSQ